MSNLITISMTILMLKTSCVLASERDDLSAQVKQIFRTRCFECHGATRQEAGIHILDASTYVGDGEYVSPGDVDSSHLFDTVCSDDEDVRMPQSPLPPLQPFEIQAIRQWIAGGAKPFPKDIPADQANDDRNTGTEHVLETILTHIRTVPRESRKYVRYFSSNHLLSAGATQQDLKLQQQALAKALNHLSWVNQIVVPEIVDHPVGSILAVDIRKLGWSATPYRVVREGTLHEMSSLNLYDQVLLEYPYSIALQNSKTFDELRDHYFMNAGLVRPIPFVRTDWFASIATQFPLYEDMLQLPHALAKLEHDLGVDATMNIETGRAQRAGMTVSGVSRNNRVVERHQSRYGAYWKSYDFETSRGQQNMFVDPVRFHYAGGEMIWNLPNGLQGYLITDSLGNRINAAPTSIVTDKFAEDKVVRNGLACMRCHERGVKRFADNIRPAFESLADSSRGDMRDILSLYVSSETMNEHLKADEARFLDALEAAFKEPQEQEPLIPVSRRFLEAPITLSQAAGELGQRDSLALKQMFTLPEFTALGLASLTAGGVVRRDTWEDYYDRIVTKLGAGIPIIPVDGLLKRDHLSDNVSSKLVITTNKTGNTFSAGDEMAITITNNTGRQQFIELIGTDAKGAIAVLTGVLPIQNATSFRFPQNGSIRIQAQLGKELITVFASPVEFEPGTHLRGHRVADRFLHNYYHHTATGMQHIPRSLIKKTITIETR